MADFRLPLSGDVRQSILPWTFVFNPLHSQLGLVNYTINLGTSSEPEVERAVLSEVASYGKQLGRIEDALAVVLKAFKDQLKLDAQGSEAVDAFMRMVEEIAAVKAHHGRDNRAVTSSITS